MGYEEVDIIINYNSAWRIVVINRDFSWEKGSDRAGEGAVGVSNNFQRNIALFWCKGRFIGVQLGHWRWNLFYLMLSSSE